MANRARYVHQEVLVRTFLDALAAGRPSAGAVLAARSVLMGMMEREGDRGGHDDPDVALREELRDLRARMDLAYDDRLAGRIDSEYLDQRTVGWLARVRVLETALTRPESSPSVRSVPTGISPALELAELAELLMQVPDPAVQRLAVRELHSNSIGGGRDGLSVAWR